EQAADPVQQRFVERCRAAERQRQAVADERMPLGERAERLAELAADVDPVLRRDLEEVDRRVRRFLQRLDQRAGQAEAGAGDGVGALLGHVRWATHCAYEVTSFPRKRESILLFRAL